MQKEGRLDIKNVFLRNNELSKASISIWRKSSINLRKQPSPFNRRRKWDLFVERSTKVIKEQVEPERGRKQKLMEHPLAESELNNILPYSKDIINTWAALINTLDKGMNAIKAISK